MPFFFSFTSSSPKRSPGEIYVAHYGHPKLPGAKHCAILWMTSNDHAYAFQINGSTETYALKDPEVVRPLDAKTLLGMLRVGRVDGTRYDDVIKVLRTVPVVRGSLQWHCQHWIVDALAQLNQAGFEVETFTQKELVERLDKADIPS